MLKISSRLTTQFFLTKSVHIRYDIRAKKRRYRALRKATFSSDGQAASGRLYTDTGTSGKIGRYEVADVRFEACKLKSHREKLPSSSASWILERSSRLHATIGFGPTADWIYGLRSRLRSRRPIWWYTLRETRKDVKIRNNGHAKPNDTADFNAESVN